MNVSDFIDHFPKLDSLNVCVSAFIKRIPGIDVSHDKAEVLQRLEAAHWSARESLDIDKWPLLTAQQVHGDKIKAVEVGPARCADLGRRSAASLPDEHFLGFDGFVTNQRNIALGVHVADCCAVYIVDPKTPAIGLVHSGKKGTGLNIAGNAIELMREKFGSNPADLVVQLSPCIRPPHYEIDFAAQIRQDVAATGVKQIHDNGVCTACDLASYYSYRSEKGKTGRMLALLGLR